MNYNRIPSSVHASNQFLSPSALLDTECSEILTEARRRSERDFLMISLALFAGLRNSEVICLTLQIIAPYGHVSNILDLPALISKGKRPRSIPLRIDLIGDLNAFIESKPQRDEPTDPGAFLFVSHKTKNKLSARDFQRITRDISLKVLSKPVHPHIFRHTFATNLLRRSNLSVVQNALGHKSIQTTSIYTHPSMNDLQKAIQGL